MRLKLLAAAEIPGEVEAPVQVDEQRAAEGNRAEDQVHREVFQNYVPLVLKLPHQKGVPLQLKGRIQSRGGQDRGSQEEGQADGKGRHLLLLRHHQGRSFEDNGVGREGC